MKKNLVEKMQCGEEEEEEEEEDVVNQDSYVIGMTFKPCVQHHCQCNQYFKGVYVALHVCSATERELQGTEEQPGLMPLAMSTILSICQNTGSTAYISYYEVYMDRCYDLLEVKANEISVLDYKDGQIHVRGLSQFPVNTMSEFQEIFSSGVKRRKTAHTGLNDCI